MADKTAADFVMPRGQYVGKTLFEIACKDPEYLDWVAGEWTDEVGDKAREAVELPEIARRIDAAVYGD